MATRLYLHLSSVPGAESAACLRALASRQSSVTAAAAHAMLALDGKTSSRQPSSNDDSRRGDGDDGRHGKAMDCEKERHAAAAFQ